MSSSKTSGVVGVWHLDAPTRLGVDGLRDCAAVVKQQVSLVSFPDGFPAGGDVHLVVQMSVGGKRELIREGLLEIEFLSALDLEAMARELEEAADNPALGIPESFGVIVGVGDSVFCRAFAYLMSTASKNKAFDVGLLLSLFDNGIMSGDHLTLAELPTMVVRHGQMSKMSKAFMGSVPIADSVSA